MTVRKTRRDFLKKASLAAGAVLLGACTPQVVNNGQSGENPVDAAPSGSGKTTITILWHSLYKNWDDRVKPYLDAHPEIEIISLPTADDDEYVQKMTTMVAGGTPPDITKITGGRLIATASKGIYEDLRPLIDASPVLSRVWSQLPDDGKEHRYCGVQLGIPNDVDTRLWFVNLDLFEKEGIAPPTNDWTWDDMVTIGKAVTKPDENQWFASLPIHSFQDWSDWVWQAGGTVFTEDLAHVNLDTPEAITAAQFLVDFFVKHKIVPSPSLGLGDIGINFDSGKMSVAPGNSPSLGVQLSDKSTWGFKWTAIFAPKGPGGAYSFIKSNAWSVLKNAPAGDAGWKFVEWWFDDEAQKHMADLGEMVVRADMRNQYSIPKLPDHIKPAIERWATQGRGLERSPGWNVAQTAWKNELETCITGGVPVEEAMKKADAKAEADMAEVMAGLCE